MFKFIETKQYEVMTIAYINAKIHEKAMRRKKNNVEISTWASENSQVALAYKT
jgi:hypothetical protein